MSKLIPIIYKNMNYPSHIKANIHEVSGNFYKEKLNVKSPYSLHTEPSSIPKVFCSKIVKDFKSINNAQKGNIAQLWFDHGWANDFYEYINELIDKNPPPDLLEIHPPFNDYCKSFDKFFDIFNNFYIKFKKKYPSTTIVIENRFGTRYKGGRFLLSTCSDILEFCKYLKNSNIDIKIVLDYPQLFSSETKKGKKLENWMGSNPLLLVEQIIKFNHDIEKYRELIGGFHMWGKLKSGNRWIPHAGNFDTFFSANYELKHNFLSSVFSTFNDGIARYFVPEVNSGEEHFHDIVSDMENEKICGFTFDDDRLSKAIKKSFFFRLPEEYLRNRKSGFIEIKGWEIQFCFGKEGDKEYMNFCCDHRMTNCRYGRIYDDEASEELPDSLIPMDEINYSKDEKKCKNDYIKRQNEIQKELFKSKSNK
jgi:hypothetical protein